MIVSPDAWQPWGEGRIAPPGSIGDPGLAARLLAYKRGVAGAFTSVSPAEIARALPAGPLTASEKIDGETWFLRADEDGCLLLAPNGRAVSDVPVLYEAAQCLTGWHGLLAGELYAQRPTGRARVHDLHAALADPGQAARLRFVAFDLLDDGGADAQRKPFSARAARLSVLLGRGERIHPVAFHAASTAGEVADLYPRIVVQGGAEGLVVRAADGRGFKIKPDIHLDAVVVGWAEGARGLAELHLALLRPDGTFQMIGRSRIGWGRAEGYTLRARLAPLACPDAYRLAADTGTLVRWVRPEVVVEVRAHDLLTHGGYDEPIRRMRLAWDVARGWQCLGPAPSVSLPQLVFERVREDKQAVLPDVRFTQVTDLAPVAEPAAPSPQVAAPTLRLREVHAKPGSAGLAVRKLLIWTTNRQADSAWSAFVCFFTDYAPRRAEPLQTEIRVAATRERAEAMAAAWRAERLGAGWQLVRRQGEGVAAVVPSAGPVPTNVPPPVAGTIEIAFGPSRSLHWKTALQAARKLATAGSIEVEVDDAGRERRVRLTVRTQLVDEAQRIGNLLALVSAWKGTEVAVGACTVGLREAGDHLRRLLDVAACHRRHGNGGGPCRDAGGLGCNRLWVRPTVPFLDVADAGTPWFAVGRLDGETVQVDKAEIRRQVSGADQQVWSLCPAFPRDLDARIDALPDTLDPARNPAWSLIRRRDTGQPAWVVPRDLVALPPQFVRAEGPPKAPVADGVQWQTVGAPGFHGGGDRSIPPTRYADVCGQDAAVEAVRDLVELPLRHADLFRQVGVRPGSGLLLYGPPGNGKTLLAKAVAGECGAHIETVAGPELLSKWVGEAEERLRLIFTRAREREPAVILFDELDAIAPDRGAADQQHERVLVAQLLALLDGLEERGQVFVIGTTNRVDAVDPALRRPGRFDRSVYVGLPDRTGRASIFVRYLDEVRTTDGVNITELARATSGLSGADIAHVCRQAGLRRIKAALAAGQPPETVRVGQDDLLAALADLRADRIPRRLPGNEAAHAIILR